MRKLSFSVHQRSAFMVKILIVILASQPPCVFGFYLRPVDRQRQRAILMKFEPQLYRRCGELVMQQFLTPVRHQPELYTRCCWCCTFDTIKFLALGISTSTIIDLASASWASFASNHGHTLPQASQCSRWPRVACYSISYFVKDEITLMYDGDRSECL